MPSSTRKKAVVLKQSTGVDISKKDFKVCLRQQLSDDRCRIKASKTFANTTKGFGSFLSWLDKHTDKGTGMRVIMEPTGVYHERLLHYLHDAGVTVCLVPGDRGKAFGMSYGILTKTDKVDADLLARMGLERQLRIWEPFSPNLLMIKRKVRERGSLTERRTALLNRLHALCCSYAPDRSEKARLRALLDFVEKQMKVVEKEIRALVKQDGKLRERLDKVMTIKGVGFITAVTVVAEMDGFVSFRNRSQVVSYCGYDIVHRESGSSVRGKSRISKRGNSRVRRALHLPALTAKKYDAKMSSLFERVTKKSGMKMKGVVAVQRRLLVLIYALFTKNEAFDPTYEHGRKPVVMAA